MKVKVEKEANNMVKFDVEIPAKDAVTEYNKTVKKISEQVNIPGFRKGKAPRNLVEKHVGIERIKEETLETLLPRIYREAIIEHKLDVVSQPYVESYDFEIGKDLKVTARVELRPEVTLGEYKNITVTAEEYETPTDAFDKAMDSLLQRHATLNIVVDRATKATDNVMIDFDGSVNGEKIQGGAAQNYPLDLAHSNFIPGFAEKLVGHKMDEEFEIKVDFPKDYHDKKLAGQPAIFKIKIREIKEKITPELTDEFAQKVGPFKNIEELKADIQKFLDVTKEKEDKKIKENAIFDKVLDNVKIDIQDSMIERESQSLLEEYKQRLSMQGYNYDDIAKSQDMSAMMEDLKKEATMRIKNSLVIDKIAQEEDIKIEHADIEKKLNEIESTYRMNRADLLKQLKQNPAMFTTLSQQSLNEKVIQFLSENNTFKFKAKTAKKADK